MVNCGEGASFVLFAYLRRGAVRQRLNRELINALLNPFKSLPHPQPLLSKAIGNCFWRSRSFTILPLRLCFKQISYCSPQKVVRLRVMRLGLISNSTINCVWDFG